MLGDAFISLVGGTFATIIELVLQSFIAGFADPFFEFLASALCLT